MSTHRRNFFSAILVLILFCAAFSSPVSAGCNVMVVSNIAPTDPSGGPGNTQLTVSTAGTPATLAREGATERLSDLLIFDDTVGPGAGAGNCFVVGNVLRLTYNVSLTLPSSIVAATLAYFDVYDNVGAAGLIIQASSSTGLAPGGLPQTVISIVVQQGGTAAVAAGGLTAGPTGAAVRIKNLRADASTLVAGTNATASISALQGLPGGISAIVGVAQNSLAPGAGVTQTGLGRQSAGATLDVPAIFSFAENFGAAFRLGGPHVSGVFADIPTTASTLSFDVGTALPWGVTLTFPSTIETSATAGPAGIIFRLRSGGNCNGPQNCVAVYETQANGAALSTVTITTAASPNSGANGAAPAIGLFINNPSGFGDVPVVTSFTPGGVAPNSAGPGDGRQTFVGWLMRSQTTPANTLPQPGISSLSPNAALVGAPSLTLTVTGTNFVPGSVVLWNGSPRATSFVTAAQLTAILAASDLAAAATANITVLNSDGNISNAAAFSVVASVAPPYPFTYLLPHVVSGGGYTTKITVVNTSNVQNTVVVNFLSQAGALLGSTQYSVAPGGTLRVATPESERFGSTATQWAMVGAQAAVLTHVFFEYIPSGSDTVLNSVGYTDAPPLTDFSLPVELEPAPAGHAIGRSVGLALANPNSSTVAATLKLVDAGGTVLATYGVSLPALGQAAMDLSSLATFRAVLPSGNFVGSVTVAASAPISAIALADDFGPFAATPVGSGRAR